MTKRRAFDRLKKEDTQVQLPPKASEAKRNRAWEQKRADWMISYRGIPPELQEQIKSLAAQLGVPVGDVARAFLEYGLQAYQRGQLPLKPHAGRGKLTLFDG